MNVIILHNKTHTKEEMATPKAKLKDTTYNKPAKSVGLIKPRATQKPFRDSKKLKDLEELQDDLLDSDLEDTPAKKKKKRNSKVPTTPKNKTKFEKLEKPIEVFPVTNTEIKSKLLADWSDDEIHDEAILGNKIIDKTLVEDTKIESDNNKKEANPVKLFDDLKTENVEQNQTDSGILYHEKSLPNVRKFRNIPKKRDFIFDELKKSPTEVDRSKTETKSTSSKSSNKELKQMEEIQTKEKKDDKKIIVKKEIEKIPEAPKQIRISRRNKDKATATEIEHALASKTSEDIVSIKSSKKLEPNFDELRPKSTRKTTRRIAQNDIASADPGKDSEVGEDEALAQEIQNLLKETAVPDLTEDLDKKERKLPPKERGKRTFKETKKANETNTALISKKVNIDQSNLDLPTLDKATPKTESELLIAETLTQLPQTAIEFSPKKSELHKINQDNNDIAESLITLATSPPTIKPEQKLYSVPNPRKRHLRALEEKLSEPTIESKPEPKHEHLTKRQRMILDIQSSKQTVESKGETQVVKPETRLPKKRKSEYNAEFESFVGKSKTESAEKIIVASPQSEKKASRGRQTTNKDKQAKIAKSEDALFDINNMEILFENDTVPVASSNTEEVSKGNTNIKALEKNQLIKISKPHSLSPSKVILARGSPTIVARTESKVIHITKDEVSRQVSPHQRSSSVTTVVTNRSPIKTTEIRRLSSPTIVLKEQKVAQEVTTTHRKVMKLITQPDGSKTLIEEVAPRASTTSPQKIVLRASSSSPLAKGERTPTNSPVMSLKGPIVQQKAHITQTVVAASSKIIITSKGSIITTTSSG